MINPRRSGDPNRFIDAIEKARVRAGLTRVALLKAAGSGPQSNYQALASGFSKRGGTIGTIDALASVLGLELVLMTREEADNRRLAEELRRLEAKMEAKP